MICTETYERRLHSSVASVVNGSLGHGAGGSAGGEANDFARSFRDCLRESLLGTVDDFRDNIYWIVLLAHNGFSQAGGERNMLIFAWETNSSNQLP